MRLGGTNGWRGGAGGVVLAGTIAGALALAGCGGASEDERASDAVKTYISARAADDAEQVCDVIVTSLRVRIERARQKTGDDGGCPAALTEEWKGQRPVALAETKALSVRLDGDRGRVRIEGTAHGIRQRTTYSVLREDDTWHVSGGGATTTPDGRPVLTLPSEGMAPGLRTGEQVVEDAHAYDQAEPKVGDVVALHPARGVLDGSTTNCPGDPTAGRDRLCADAGTDPDGGKMIKRVVAGPGDHITFRKGHAILDGRPVEEPYADVSGCSEDYAFGCDSADTITIPAGHYYLVGDNRANSDDSRFWGAVPADWITGRVEEG